MSPRFSKPSHFTADSQTVIIRGSGLALTRRPPAGSPHPCAISEDSDCGLEMIMTVQVSEGSANATMSQAEHEHYGTRSPAGIMELQTTHCCRVTGHSARAFKFGPHPGRDWAVTKTRSTRWLSKSLLYNSDRGVKGHSPKTLAAFEQRLRSVCLSSLWITVFGRGPSRALLH